jgi:hypothetical protein
MGKIHRPAMISDGRRHSGAGRPCDGTTGQPAAVARERDATLALTADFFAAAMDTITPADELSRQVANAANGPFMPGKPEQGYQLALTPREFFQIGRCLSQPMVARDLGKNFDAFRRPIAQQR